MEESNKSISKAKWLDAILVLLMAVIPLVLIKHYNVTAVFYNNDDLYLSEIVSGIMTGRPEGQLLHISYLTGMLISRLYIIWPSVPWYGIFLFSLMYGSIVSAFAFMLFRADKAICKIMMAIVADYMICSFFFCHLVEIQYTTVTIVVGATALVAFVLAKDCESVKGYLKNNIVSFLFFFLSFSIRDKACVMLLPVFFFFGLAKLLKNKKMFKPLLAYAMGLVAVMALLFGIERLGYSSERWTEFEKYNSAREQVMDYTGYPNYQEYREVYEEMGISEKSQASLPRYQLLLDENVNADFMMRMEEITAENKKFNLGSTIKHFITLHTTSYIDRPINIIVYFMYAVAIGLALISKKNKALYDVLALFLGRMVIWAYIMYIGRIMTRVTQGIYMLELMVLFAVIASNVLWIGQKKAKQRTLVVATVCVLAGTVFICHRWGLPYSEKIFYYNQSQMAYATCYKEIREYCEKSPEKLFLADTYSFSYFTEDIFAQPEYSAANFIMLGSWTANSPWTDYVAKRYAIDSYEEAAIMRDNVYFIFMDSELTPWQYLEDYYAEKYPGSVTEIEEVLETSFGRDFFVIKVRRE